MFGFKIVKKSEILQKERTIEGLLKDRDVLQRQLNSEIESGRSARQLVIDLSRPKSFTDVPIDMSDPTPDKPDDRRGYVARVAGFYTDILKSKLLYMISNTHSLFENEENSPKQDNLLKTVAYVCREMMRWGEQMVNEQISYQVEPLSEQQKTTADDVEKKLADLIKK